MRKARLLLVPIGASAFVSTWGGWVGLARMTGFGKVNLLPGFVPDGSWSSIDLAITLPLGVEAYAAYAMSVWFGKGYTRRAQTFAAVSAVFSLLLAGAGQISFHTLEARSVAVAPNWLVALVALIPVLVIGMTAALMHLTSETSHDETATETTLGKVFKAAGEKAVRRLNRDAETAAETARDETPSSQRPEPQPSHRAVSPTVSAGQSVETLFRPIGLTSDPETLNKVETWMGETPRPSLKEIADRLGVSKATAGRLTKAVSETTETTETKPTNGHPVLTGGGGKN